MADFNSCSIIPVAFSPQRELLFLLGREDGRTRFAKRWADFGGKKKMFDKNSPYACAAREFVEESGGSVPFFIDEVGDVPGVLCDTPERMRRIADALDERHWIARLTITPPGRTCRHVFVVLIPYDAAVPHNFGVVRAAQDAAAGKWKVDSRGGEPWVLPGFVRTKSNEIRCKGDFMEKRELKWWSCQDLMTVVESDRGEGALSPTSPYGFRGDFLATLKELRPLLQRGPRGLKEGQTALCSGTQ